MFKTMTMDEIERQCAEDERRLLAEMKAGTKCWGRWKYDPADRILYFEDDAYGVPLEECRTAMEILDWMAQLHNKDWMDPEQVGHLFYALCEIFGSEEIRHWEEEQDIDAILRKKGL